jgi:ribulose-5-phosphate 4-epimerase/fuculose-1-phosphate aldolase
MTVQNRSATPNPRLVDKLVVANRILYDQGVVDGLGHISVRHDSAPGVFLLSCSRAPGLVVHQDIVCYDLDGNALSPDAERPYLERFIHGEIYRARPDVVAVVHSHSPSVIPFGATKQDLKPIFHMAGFLGGGSAHFDIREAAGDTDMLIRSNELGRYLAQSLGAHSCVLMRGHGSTTVGNSIEQVVYRAIYAEVNAKLQAQAMSMGAITYLTQEEARLASDTNDGVITRSWDLWQRRIGPIER